MSHAALVEVVVEMVVVLWPVVVALVVVVSQSGETADTLAAMREAKRRGAKTGIATLCVSGGMGMAVLFER